MGFLTTIQNIIDVAKLNAYLSFVSCCFGHEVRDYEPSEDVLRVVVPEIHSWRPTNRHTLGFALVVCEQVRYYP